MDTPEAAIPGWWEGMWREVQQRLKNGPAVVLLDEIQYLRQWDRLMKTKADQIWREQRPVQVVLSGSSAMLMSRGLKETMAGRFEQLRLLHWPASDLKAAFGLNDEEAIACLVERGSYPGAFPLIEDKRFITGVRNRWRWTVFLWAVGANGRWK